MKILLLVITTLLGVKTFGVSLNTEVRINFPQEKTMSIDIDMCIQTVGLTNRESILDRQLKLKSYPPAEDVETLKTAFEGIVEVGTFLYVIEEAIRSSEVEDLAVFSMSDLPIKVLITRPLLPIYFDFVRGFNDKYIVKEDDWLEAIDEIEKLNKEWDENIRNIYLSQ